MMMLFILLLVIPVSSAQICSSNITLCETEYIDRIIKPMGITYVPIEKLKIIIRYYNYNYKIINIQGRNKREKRKLRKQYYNYNLFSHSKELDYLEHICSVNYDKLDVSRLSYKYNKINTHIYNYKSIYNFIKLSIIFILMIGCIMVSLY